MCSWGCRSVGKWKSCFFPIDGIPRMNFGTLGNSFRLSTGSLGISGPIARAELTTLSELWTRPVSNTWSSTGSRLLYSPNHNWSAFFTYNEHWLRVDDLNSPIRTHRKGQSIHLSYAQASKYSTTKNHSLKWLLSTPLPSLSLGLGFNRDSPSQMMRKLCEECSAISRSTSDCRRKDLITRFASRSRESPLAVECLATSRFHYNCLWSHDCASFHQ